MGRKTNKKNNSPDLDNVCGYCLFFRAQTSRSGPLRSGNCSYHKERIENAYRTTCSDMSHRPLAEKGIYRLVAESGKGWQYIRRTEKLRTRLFAVK